MSLNNRRKRFKADLDLLIEKAGVQGYLTSDDLMEVVPDEDIDHLSVVLLALRRRGVEIFDCSEEQFSPTPDFPSPFCDAQPDNEDAFASDDIIGLYLKEMSSVPLLSAQEELEIAIRIEKGQQARDELQRTRGRLATARRKQLEESIQDGALAQEHLIKANTRLVVSIAKRYVGHGVPFLDLIQEGNLGLMKATEKYEYRRGFRFSTYATWWIRQTITRAIACQGRTIRVPVHMVDRIRQIYKAQHDLEQRLGRPPTTEELSCEVGVSMPKLQWILKVARIPLSLEAPISNDEDAELGQFIEDTLSPSPLQSVYYVMLKERVEEVLGALPAREARVLRLRFGLDDGKTYTLEEVGQKFGLTRERIRQIENHALRQLRQPRYTRRLKDYL